MKDKTRRRKTLSDHMQGELWSGKCESYVDRNLAVIPKKKNQGKLQAWLHLSEPNIALWQNLARKGLNFDAGSLDIKASMEIKLKP